jgi:hypothetical protein
MDMPSSMDMPAAAMHGEHSGHAMDHEMAESTECGHCPPGGHAASGDCLSATMPACDLNTDVAADGRNTKLKAGKLQDDAGYIVSTVDPPPGRTAPAEYIADCRPRLLPDGPSLNVQYCVFLK